jgi:superfamily I DNA and/or RNA helicase
MLRGKKIVLAGDHLQLPPTVKSTEALNKDLGTTTFFERMINREKRYQREADRRKETLESTGEDDEDEMEIGATAGTTLMKSERRPPGRLSAMLTVQYRMNDLIMRYSSQALYESRLVSHESVAHHRLIDSKRIRFGTDVEEDEFSTNPLILVDTAGLDLAELGGESESKRNEGEADVVCAIIEKLISWEKGPRLDIPAVGVISPYNSQVELLREKLRPKYPLLEINSVDSFQGREKEAIVMSLVRSNSQHEVGFLKSDQRTNVAITRARKCLVVVTDTETTSSHGFLRGLFKCVPKTI